MAEETRLRLQTLNLSAKQITAATGWPDFMTNDYLTNFTNSVLLSQSTDGNSTSVEENKQNISINKENLELHESLNSAHGVTGDNVGAEDFAQSLMGGVVLLMELVDDANTSTQEVTFPDILNAPASYDQTYMQGVASMCNDLKAKHNQLLIDMNAAIIQLNDLIAKSKVAKQMGV
tara:strand:- start:1074 stop:1601 length:528 start_codon:yes stop_codon:yes gene_type:complete